MSRKKVLLLLLFTCPVFACCWGEKSLPIIEAVKKADALTNTDAPVTIQVTFTCRSCQAPNEKIRNAILTTNPRDLSPKSCSQTYFCHDCSFANTLPPGCYEIYAQKKIAPPQR
jgi:hypothetical protein